MAVALGNVVPARRASACPTKADIATAHGFAGAASRAALAKYERLK